MSPHISVGGTLGIEDVLVPVRLIQRSSSLQAALAEYEKSGKPHYQKNHELADAVERAGNAQEYALHRARFSHWMLNDGAAHSCIYESLSRPQVGSRVAR